MKKPIHIVSATIVTVLLLSGCVTENGDRQTDMQLDRKVDSVLLLMTLDEKLGQLTLYTSDWDVTGPTIRPDYMDDIRSGKCGNIFNAHTVAYNKKLQRIAVEETRLGIPLMFGYDVIHGHKTIFPIPLAEACSWNLGLMKKSAKLAAKEAAASGLNWTFAPMVDISRDPRWGRVSEGNGEDTYLGACISEVRVHGFQGRDLSDPYTIAACIKHFAAYGAPVAGRDYNTVEMSEISLRQDYLLPYQKGIEAGAVTAMASFNDLFGVPATASKYLMTDILRDEWGFEGFVVSDYDGIDQLRDHGVAEDKQHAGELALTAGIDMDMQSAIFVDFPALSLEEGKVSMDDINAAVKRVLRVKFQLGLFDDPYRYFDESREAEIVFSEELMDHALQSALESVVLLKNEAENGRKILPLTAPKKIALIGPLADNQLDMLGSWHAAGDHTRVVTLLEGLQKKYTSTEISYARGCDFYAEERSGFSRALHLAKTSDVVILAIGENQEHSGEAASRSNIDIPGIQEELALALIETGTPVIVVIMAERPLTFPVLNEKASAILYAWHLGTRAGDALADVLSGACNPSGKLVMSIPENTGQIPVYYNSKSTGRPDDPSNKYTSKYLDVSNNPLYPFGYGLSYTIFEYGEVRLSDAIIGMNDTLEVSISVKNTGDYDGEEVVQLYVRDMVGSLTRPVKELRAFKKISVPRGEEHKLHFSLTREDLKFVGGDLEYIAEPGDFKVFIGPDSENLKEAGFTLKN
ncbi:MAG: glycoside hydrolase family 3 C-terminal domain-containing protein [Bacteroidales bacterium]|nr:glycoside hydrolase family 3 C-terminal domain-containing protein [Bacteroidales bacterium]